MLVPLINQLLKPEVYQTDPLGMSETRVQAAQLLCKVFLHYLVLLSEWEGVLDLWVKILAIMDRLLNSGQNESLVEAVPESLKNILLVMSSGGYLVPPSEKPDEQTEQQKQLWTETWTRLERFLPDLMPEIFPGEAYKPKTPVRTSREGRTGEEPKDDATKSPTRRSTADRPASAVAEPQTA